eukprot:403358280
MEQTQKPQPSKQLHIGILYSENKQHCYYLIKKIGQGTFSTVYLCESQNKEDFGVQYAIKVNYENEQLTDYRRDIVFNEMMAIQKIQSHPNIIHLQNVFEHGFIKNSDQSQIRVFAVLVLEVLRGGELYYHIRRAEKFSVETSLAYFKQLASAISHLVENNICHRDLKPWNIMVNDDLSQLKIIDFGYATPLDIEKQEDISTYLKGFLSCTKNYTPPEMYAKVISSPLDKVDVFSIGVILVNLLTGNFPFQQTVDRNRDDQLNREYLNFLSDPSLFLKQENVHSENGTQLENLSELIKGMLQPELSQRFSIQEVLQHKWIQENKENTSEQIKNELLQIYNSQNSNDRQVKQNISVEKVKLPIREEPLSEYTTNIQMPKDLDMILNMLQELASIYNAQLMKISEYQFQLEVQESRNDLALSQQIKIALEFYGDDESIKIELSRVKGDYLSFMDLFFGLYVIVKASKGQSSFALDESKYSKQQLLIILEDLRIEYTPYYIHYYHSLQAVNQDYHSRPKLVESLTKKIQERLALKTDEVHQSILKKYMIDSQQLHDWISHYIDDPQIKKQVDVIDVNNERLFGEPLQEPNFNLEFPENLTKEVYLKILAKVFASIRHIIYKQIRTIVRARDEKYLTKNEMKDILHNLDTQSIRNRVFEIYGLPEPSPRQPSHRILQKAHYTYMIDKDFMQMVRELKQSHERFMTAIMGSDVFPGLDTTDPLKSSENDSIPKRFGSNWFEHQNDQNEVAKEKEEEENKESKQVFRSIDQSDNDHEQFSDQLLNKDVIVMSDLDDHLDSQRRLLFTETKMRISPEHLEEQSRHNK